MGVFAFAVFGATAQYHDPLNNDTRAAAVAAWQLAHHGNATLDAFSQHYAWIFESHGRYVTNRLPGVIFWATPFYALLGGGGYPAIYPGAFAAALASAIAIAIVYVLAARLVSRRAAVLVALLLGFATGTWTVSADQLWTHGPAQAAVLLTVLSASRRQWLLAGAPAGFAILIRPHLGIVAVVICAFALVRHKTLRPLLIGIGCAAGAAVLLAYNRSLWHEWTIFGGYDQPVAASGHKFEALVTGVLGDLVSPERGLLVMTPALLLLLPGLQRAWASAPEWVRSAAIAGLAYLALQLWGIRFWGGDGFYSYRTTLETLTLCAPLLVLGWREWTAKTLCRRVAFAALAALSVTLHAFGAVINWVPGGTNLSPWRTYMPFDLARHIGAAQTAGWIATAVIAVAVAVIWTLHQSRRPNNNQPSDDDTKLAVA
ncbi:MAG TPA: glycosyltransferase family 39 protein [Acidothermaceae bacterium]